MKVPKSVKVGFKQIKLVPVTTLLTAGDRLAEYKDGRDGTKPRIEYEEHLHGKELLATLIHEVFHATCEMHIPAGTITAMPHEAMKIEEVFVDALSIGWVIFWAENPGFMEWAWEVINE